MTSNGHSEEPKRSVYDTCDPHYLRALREAAGMDMFVLARTACLSVAQVRQLESDESDSLFYSEAIKRQAYKRLLMILGAEPPTVEVPQELRDAHKVADAHLDTLDQIVAMSHQPSMNRSTADTLRAGVHRVLEHKQVLGALLFLSVAVVLFVLHGPQSMKDAQATSTAQAAEPVAAPAKSEPVVTLAAVPAPAPVVAASLPAPVVLPEAATPAVVVAPVAAVTSSNVCAYSNEAMPQLTPFVAHKEGRYVYLVSTTQVDVCVVDGNKQATTVQMKAGENRSVYGVAPWQVSGPQLQKVQIYFQGGRVSLPDAVTRVKLQEVPVAR